MYMKKNFTIIAILCILLTSLTFHSFAQVPDTWTKKADFTGPSRGQAVGFAIGEKGFIGLGDINGGYQNDLWEYDPSTDSWTQKADFPGTARASANGFSVNNKGYVACGDDGTPKKDVWEFDPVTNNWTQKNDFPGLPRQGAFTFTIGSKAYLGAGVISMSPVVRGADFWEYDPTNDTWIQKHDILGLPVGWPVGFSIESKGYMGTGNDGIKEKYFYEYDPSIDTWTQKADFGGIGRFQAVGLAVGGKGYIGLGDRSGGYTNDFWEYNPTLDTWTQRASFGGQSRTLSTGFATSNKAYVGTGFNSSYTPLNDFWEYTPCSAPVISVEPSNKIVTYGEAASFSVVVTNASSYHWQLNTGTGFTNITEGGIYSNTTTSTLDISIPTVAMSGYKYRCEINGYCTETITTNGNATLTVAPKPIVINPSAGQAKIYNSTEPISFSYTFAPSLIGTDVITGLMKRVAGENVGNFAFTLGTLSAGANYSLSIAATPTFSITPIPVVITPIAGQKKVYGSVEPLTFSYTFAPSLIGTDVITGLMKRTAGENAGDYAFTLGTLSAGANYSLSIAATPTFSITLIPVVITPVAGQKKVYGSVEPTTFSYTFAPSLIGTDVITGLMKRVAGENVGDYAFTLGTLSAGANYSLSIAATPTFSITPLPIVITPVAGQSKAYGSADPALFSYTFTPALVGTDAFTGLMERTAGENVGDYPFTLGTLSAGANYSLSIAVTPIFSITPLPVVITPDASQSKIYGSADPALFSYTFTPALVGTDGFTGLMERTAGENVGEYAFTLGTVSVGANYSLSIAATPSFSITPMPVVITPVAGQKKVYGSVEPTTFSYTFAPSLIGTDVITGSMGRVAGENAGDYLFSLGSLTAGTNYSLSVATVPVYTIETKELTVFAEDKIKCFDNLIFSGDYTVTYEGFVNSEDPSVLTGNLVFGGSAITAIDPSTYSIEPSGLTSINYLITFVNGPLTIKPTPATPVIVHSYDTLISNAVSGNQWYKDGIELTGSIEQKHQVTSNGVYYTIVTVNGCASEPSNSISVLDVSISKVSSEIFEIYPNPSHGILNVKLKSTGNEVFNIVIYNNLGAIVWKQNNTSFNGTNITQIDLNNSNEGLYTVVLSNNTRSYAKKVLVTK